MGKAKNHNQDLQELSDAILNGVERLLTGLETKLDQLGAEIKAGQQDLQRQVNDLKDTPSRQEFERLKQKVDRYLPPL